MYIIKLQIHGEILTSKGFIKVEKGTELRFAERFSEAQALGIVVGINELAGKRVCYADKL